MKKFDIVINKINFNSITSIASDTLLMAAVIKPTSPADRLSTIFGFGFNIPAYSI